MANNFYGAIALTGGGSGALDAIDGDVLSDGDGAIVLDATDNTFHMYTLDASSGAAESDPGVIAPDSNPGNKRWIILAWEGTINTSLAAIVGALTCASISLGDAANILMDSAPASDHNGTGMVINQTVDANSYGIGGLLVLSSDGNWDDADADAEATVGQLAIALEAGTGTKALLLSGIMRDDTWNFTPGVQLYVSTTLGEITETAPSASGDFVQVVGYALTADIIVFNPSPDYVELA